MKFIPLLQYLSKVNDVRDIINRIVNEKTEQLDFNIIDKMINNNIRKSGPPEDVSEYEVLSELFSLS